MADKGRDGQPFGPDYDDGERYRGRGYVQLTGRYNYQQATKILNKVGYQFDLISDPDLASSPGNAERLLVAFIDARKTAIKHAMASKDYVSARKCVNAHAEGMDRFIDAVSRYYKLSATQQEPIATRPASPLP